MRSTIWKTFAAAALLLGGLLAGCGDEGATIEEACTTFCGCRAPDERAACQTSCVETARQEMRSQACLDCLAAATCDELAASACNATCEAD